jgi:hypothetical protein
MGCNASTDAAGNAPAEFESKIQVSKKQMNVGGKDKDSKTTSKDKDKDKSKSVTKDKDKSKSSTVEKRTVGADTRRDKLAEPKKNVRVAVNYIEAPVVNVQAPRPEIHV